MPRWIGLFFLFGGLLAAHAIDVDPSKRVVPDKFINPPGPKMRMLAGDPKRIEKANRLDPKAFVTKLEVAPNPLSLQERKAAGNAPTFAVTLSLKNTGKKTGTLFFPNAQRYDIIVKSPQGQVVYTWSADKEFAQEEGAVLINENDKIVYTEAITLSDCKPGLAAGIYTVEASFAGYPIFTGKTVLQVVP